MRITPEGLSSRDQPEKQRRRVADTKPACDLKQLLVDELPPEKRLDSLTALGKEEPDGTLQKYLEGSSLFVLTPIDPSELTPKS